MTLYEEYSLRVLEYCKAYPQCRFELRVNPNMLDKQCARVFNNLFKKTKASVYDYDLIGYIAGIETIDNWIESKKESVIDKSFEVFDNNGVLFCSLEDTPMKILQGDSYLQELKSDMIKHALSMFNFITSELNKINLTKNWSYSYD